MAIPPAANKAASEVVFTPNAPTEITINNTVSEIDTNDVTNDAIVFSVLRRSKTCLRMFFTHRIRKIPMIKINKAASTLMPNCVTFSTKIFQNPSGSVLAYSIICFAPSLTESAGKMGISCKSTITLFMILRFTI